MVKQRDTTKLAALRGGRKDEEVREEIKSAALSGGREGEEDRDENKSAALSEGCEDNLVEGGDSRDTSESITLNEGHGTQDDFLVALAEVDAGELAALCGAHGACPECLMGLVIVMVKGERMRLTFRWRRPGAFIHCAAAVSMPVGPLTSKSWCLKGRQGTIKTTEASTSVPW